MKRKKSALGAAGPLSRSEEPLTVVCIGASAGGLEPLSRLFRRLPPDLGLAYVVILHLQPDHESNLRDILQRSTQMPVIPAKNGAALQANRVYVIVPNVKLTLERGRLVVSPRDPGVAMPIDNFLRSLARDRRRRAIAVILSGSGSDGAVGVRAIKGEGGVVFAQDAESAGHPGMPQSAIATEAVDFTLPPEDIAIDLARVARHPFLAVGSRESHPALGDEESLRHIFAIVRRATGVDFSLYKSTTVGRRLLRRLVLHKIDTLKSYAELLERDPNEVQAFCEETLIHVTHFFREPETFEALQKRVLPRLIKGNPRDPSLRVWVPGCSTGEEAYSLAICLLDALGDRVNLRRPQIFATDVSEATIDRARLGVYPEGIRDDVPPRLLRRYFTKTDNGYQVSKTVRDMCIFAKQNLAKDPPFANLDLISCRNVLIYLEPALQRRILGIFHYGLKPAGVLVLGVAETVGDYSSMFIPIDKKGHVYFKKSGSMGRRLALRTDVFDIPGLPEKPKRAAKSTGWPESDVQKTADRLMLARFAPAGVIVNSDLEILHFRGPVHRFLKPATGKASLNLMKMLPEEWHVVVRSLIDRARKSGEAIRQDGIPSREIGQSLALEIIPVPGPPAEPRCFLLLFEVEPGPSVRPARGKTRRAARPPDEKLRAELESTKDYLQAIVEDHEASNEELKAANEEIISSNEELQSTNEELETAKEELQAANEELSTLNEELRTRNAELSMSNNDLVNLLVSVNLPIVMLGNDLRIRHFTPMAEKVMNLIPGDIGRPIGDIKPRVNVRDLEQRIADVIESVTTSEEEVRDNEGRSYSLRIRPYKTIDNKIDGAVLLLIDIEEIKKAALNLRENALFAEAVLDMIDEAVVVLDTKLTVRSANAAFRRRFESASGLAGRSLLEVAGGRLDLPPLRRALKNLAEKGEPFSELSLTIGGARMAASGRRQPVEGRPALIVTLAFPGV
ncbi:MAG: PAS domain-containing protein [Elusimicrobia bacterium]|nr:PAS domain-containing protein [Elusimicrobiota bacterium]